VSLISTKKYTLAAFLLFLLGLSLLTSCSTKKNTFTRRVYHNVTSHYNVYWNGMDGLRQGLKEYKASLKDNYALVLPVYNYGDRAAAAKISQFADISIKKASKTIQKHSMPFNRKEYCRWIDDAYMLIGQSYFYKQDYPMARRTFEFIIKTYNDNAIKYDAMLWLARSNMQIGDFNRAEPMLDMIASKIKKGEAPDKYETDLNLDYAQFYLLQKNYDGAIPYLTRALELNPGGEMKTRCRFILAQIYQRSGALDEASALYAMVIKKAQTYEMEFNAKINMAQCYNANSGNREFIVKKLTRMLKDDKNQDFLDQIYYSLAQISLRDADTGTAVGYFQKSVSTSKTNAYQKAISSLELADIFFSKKDYANAQSYYDSTMQFLPKDYPGFKEIQKKTNTLTDLVTNLRIIQKQDSLQSLATMSEEDRNKSIDMIIGKIIAEELRKKMEEQEKKENLNLFGQSKPGDITGSGSKEGRWYFYNPTTLSNGYSNFVRKWGRRKYEDTWCLSNKTIVAFSGEAPLDSAAGLPGDTLMVKDGMKTITRSNNPKDRNYYLQEIPFTNEQVSVSNKKIIQAYYETGFIYLDGLNDYGNSVASFETLLQRFPDNMYNVQTYYKLYQMYKDLENQPQSDHYKNLILNGFPDSDYAKLLANPNFYKEMIAKQSQAANLYEATFRAFENQQYYMVISNADQAHTNFKADTSLLPKFDYLRALAIGKIEIVDSLVVAMYKIIKDYPKSDVRRMAENVLTYLGTQQDSSGKPIATDSTTILDNSQRLYKHDPNAVHFYILIVNGDLVDVDALKMKISDFNSKFNDLDNLQVNSLVFDDKNQMVTVSNFESALRAMDYFYNIRDSKYIFTKLENTGNYYDFVISVENYPVLYRNKDISQYLRFFEKNYTAAK
jgi:tetratricopeptide (TPR) repeat protein